MVVSTQPPGPSVLRILHTFMNPYLYYKFQAYALNLNPISIAIPQTPRVMPVGRRKPIGKSLGINRC